MSEGFRTFDHTGDLGLEVWADSPERLLALEADDPEDLLVHWLNSALLEAEVRRAVWTRARVHRLTPRAIEARLEGPRLDPARHTLLREVKAVSHHHLSLRLEP